MLPFEEIVPVAAKEGLEKVATNHGTSREMLLLSALTSTSALIGKSTLQVFSTYGEKGMYRSDRGTFGTKNRKKYCDGQHVVQRPVQSFCVRRHSPCPLHRRGTFTFNENNKFVQVSPSRPDTGTLVQMFRRRLLVRAEGEQRQTHRELHF